MTDVTEAHLIEEPVNVPLPVPCRASSTQCDAESKTRTENQVEYGDSPHMSSARSHPPFATWNTGCAAP